MSVSKGRKRRLVQALDPFTSDTFLTAKTAKSAHLPLRLRSGYDGQAENEKVAIHVRYSTINESRIQASYIDSRLLRSDIFVEIAMTNLPEFVNITTGRR